ncbi:MAG: hypothetical protein WC900_06035 [Oscillospiraceae bacterium]|jgi:hypothetical protein
MIKLITGKKGTGKTKIMIDMIKEAAASTKGSLVCIDKGAKLTYDIPHSVRLADVEEYSIEGFDAFYGFVAGLFAGNFDISEVFVDSILKIGGRDYKELGNMLEKIDKISKEIVVAFTVSADREDLPESVTRYINA